VVAVVRDLSVMLGVAGSIMNDVIMRIAGLRVAGLWRYGDWRYVAMGCNALVVFDSGIVVHAVFLH